MRRVEGSLPTGFAMPDDTAAGTCRTRVWSDCCGKTGEEWKIKVAEISAQQRRRAFFENLQRHTFYAYIRFFGRTQFAFSYFSFKFANCRSH